ncbi:MAG TPA: type VI secretion system membrane subunit TssM, partial [Burkholderiales bacterium]|nr:type VI secretion system membrane subunit TssM [Burkholderiales bacterium]
MRAVLAFFRKRWVLTLVGLLAISLLIWFVGPLFAFANYKPLEAELPRWILIALLFVAWISRQAWRWAKELRANRQLLASLATPIQPPQPTEAERASAEEVSDLRQRMQEALAILKKMRVKGTFGTRYVYQLPWYIIIGAPGAGKTTALLNSGLRFPLADRLGPEAIRGVGGTRRCDWWFTDEAVLLDTAGRYTTQDSDKEVDKAGWSGFLALLKRYRGRRPINGVLIAVSLPDLLRQAEAEREQHAREIRQRLQELHDTLGIRFPVYVLFTKCDLLAGFIEFFSDMGQEQRGQVWGITFRVTEQPDPGAALAELGTRIGELEKRLNGRLLPRLQQERDPQRRTLIYSFPQQLSAAESAVITFLNDVFLASRFEDRSMLRGIYLTSGTQEGMPLDRVMTSLARAYGLQQSPLPTSVASGKSYFITRLLKAVIFPEAELSGTNLRLERQRAWLRRGAYIGIGAVSALILLAWLVSYQRNQAYTAEVNRQAQQIRAQLQAPSGDQRGLEVTLPLLEMLRKIPGGYDERDGSVPLSMRFGLYQGGKLGDEAQAAYERALERMLLPRVVQRMEEQLRAGGGDYERQFEALKAYLMLGDPRRFDSRTVQNWAQRDWVERAQGISPEQRDDLRRHTDALFEDSSLTQSIALDDKLVDEVRRRLLTASPAKRMFERLKRDPGAAKLEEFTVLKAAGPEAQFVLARKTGQPLASGIPGLFTYRGYHEFFKTHLELALAADLNEAWVLGNKPGGSAIQASQLLEEVRRLYFEEYIGRWEVLLNDVTPAPMPNLDRAAETLNLLSRPDSPLRKFLEAAARETTLGVRPISSQSVAGLDIGKIVGKTLERTPLGQGED